MSLFLGKRPPYNKRVQNGLELLILIRASYWMALWLGSMHLCAAYSNLSTFRTDLISRGICKFDLVSIILVEWRAQMFLSLWWPNAVIIATQFSVWSSTGRLSTATILSKVPNAQPMHSQYTANAQPIHSQCTANAQPMHSQYSSTDESVGMHIRALPWSGQHEGLACPGLPLKSHLFCPPLTFAGSGLPWKEDCHRGSKQAESNALGLPLKSHLFCARSHSSKEPLHADDSK